MIGFSLGDGHRWRWLLGTLMVVLSSGCFHSVDPNVSTMVCHTNKNCPKGYECAIPGTPGGCRRVGSELDSGNVVDLAGMDGVGDTVKPLDGGDTPPSDGPDTGGVSDGSGGNIQSDAPSGTGGDAAGGSSGSGGAAGGSSGSGGATGGSSGSGGATGDSGGSGGAADGSASGGTGGTGGIPTPDGGPDGPVDPCSPSPCVHGTCQRSAATYTCDCTGTGYNGNNCQTDIDECATNNGGCDKLTTCTNTSGGRACGLCPSGYTGTGATACVDIDECATNNGGCDPLTACTNKPGSYTCGSCPSGYTSSGPTDCVDIDECKTNNGGCDSLTTCTNTPGSRTCGACPSGYTGTGVTGCTDVNECATNNGGCDTNATCTNTTGSRTCACNTGYSGNGVTCADVNECLSNNGGCDTNATCTNTTGSRTCACKSGFSGDGITCTNINDCSPNPCHNGGSCTDLVSSFSCNCVSPWSGQTCDSGTLTVNASARGFYTSTTWMPPSYGNTCTGFQGSDLEERAYFGFNLPSFSGTVSSVTLNLEVAAYSSPDSYESFFVYDVSTPLATVTSNTSPSIAIFDDLGTGTNYGSFTLNADSVGTIKSIVLTPAITAVSNARGSTFAVGIAEFTFSNEGGEVASFSTDTESRTHQLEIKVVP